MKSIEDQIKDIDKVICSNIEMLGASERGLLSQNIIAQLRNFVEYISLKIYSDGYGIQTTYSNITDAVAFVYSRGNLRFLSNFHKLLQKSASHYTLDGENSERLMLKYYEYLIRVKKYLKNAYELEVLENIEDFPIQMDSTLIEYYKKIEERIISSPSKYRRLDVYYDSFYIQKIKPFFIGTEIYYEVTFTRASDNVSKFDRVIAFTKLDISLNYAVKLSVSSDIINILGKNMPILIIDRWEVSIRPCEFTNLARIFSIDVKFGRTIEYESLMKFLTSTGINLIELLDLSDKQFFTIKSRLTEKAKVNHIFNLLESCRSITSTKSGGCNVIRYLLLRLNNVLIKKQYDSNPCDLLSKLKLKWSCVPFDKLPFNTSLTGHNPKLSDLFDCLDFSEREHELFARFIKNNTEQKSHLYTPLNEIDSFEDCDRHIQKWNESIYKNHQGRKLEKFHDHIYIKEYEDDTIDIVRKLKDLASIGVKNYSNSVDSWLEKSIYPIDSEEKREALRLLFENSRVALIYGAAGTGKSTMINHISNFFNDERKLFLANTNPAVDNLKRKVKAANCTFYTINSFLYRNDSDFDMLVIDECSTVSNSDMVDILNKASFKLLVLVGDIFQIESILFGNWFDIANSFVPSSSIFELKNPYRTNNDNLLNLWDKVRNIDDDITEHITRYNYSVSLDESIFEHTEEDEIILCLNYDGLYGINNVNNFLQSSNESSPIEWGTHTYKVNDPIIFNETDRFKPVIYNNLKGIIKGIEVFDDKIQFDIEIDKVLNELDSLDYDFELIENTANRNSIIRFFVYKHITTDEDEDSSSNRVVPFQVAYAVSIHKAQGLEYNSVKVVITDETDELISHNIFYTAITRAREKLKIYWTPESEHKVICSFEKKRNMKDAKLLKLKLELL